MIWLAQHRADGRFGAEQIARETKASPSYLAKILQQLAEGGIVSSRRGVGGGFQLERDIESLTMLEVINAVEPIQRIDKCPLNLKTHRDCRCPAHARLDEALALIEVALRNSTIRDILYEKGRPQPLIETVGKK